MNVKRVLPVCLLFLVVSVTGCSDGGGGPTGPANAPVLSNVTVNPLQANPGAIIIFSIDFVDVPGDLNGGSAVITDNQGFRYEAIVSNAEGTTGILTTSIELSPLVTPGELLFTILIWDRAGNQGNPVYVTLVVI